MSSGISDSCFAFIDNYCKDIIEDIKVNIRHSSDLVAIPTGMT